VETRTMTSPSRRRFLQTALAAGAACGLAGRPAAAIEPIQRVGKPNIRLSCAAYSYRQYLNLAKKPKPDMDLDGFIERCAEMGLDAVELTAYYFAQTTPEYLAHLKSKCTRLGLDVSGTAVGNDFCVTDPAKLAAQKKMVRDWVEHTTRLGGKTIRIFAGKAEKNDTEEAARSRAVEAIEEACEYAARYGIFLALENHGGITATPEQMLAIIKAVKSPAFGVNFDTGNFHTADPYADLAKIAPYAVVSQIKTEVHPGGKREDADLKRLLDILKATGFRGYVALEYEAAEDPMTAVPKAIAALRKAL
jgi:sugar phosphate isomerase/epimerase